MAKPLGHALIVDVETTGFSPEHHEVLEIGMILFSYDKENNSIIEIIDEYSGLREPTRPIPSAASKVHGIRRKDVKGHYLDNGKMAGMCELADIIIAHNAVFDYGFASKLLNGFKNKDWYCTMNAICWEEEYAYSRKLTDLAAHYRIEHENPHRALSDSKVVYDLLCHSNKFNTLISSAPIEKPKKPVPEKYKQYRKPAEIKRPAVKPRSGNLGCIYAFIIIGCTGGGGAIGGFLGFLIGLIVAIIITVYIEKGQDR